MVKKVPPIKELRKICQTFENRKNLNLKRKFFNHISIYLTKVLLYTPITANQVTFLMLILGLISVVFFMKGQYIYSLVGVLFYNLYILFDWCDGEVARYSKVYSFGGSYLDYMAHTIVNPLIILCIALGAYFNNPLPIPDYIFLIAGFSGAYSFMINQFARLKKYEMYLDKGKVKKLIKLQKRFKKGHENKIKKIFHNFFRLEMFGAIVFFGILNLLPYLALIYGIILPIMAFSRFYSEFKQEK